MAKKGEADHDQNTLQQSAKRKSPRVASFKNKPEDPIIIKEEEEEVITGKEEGMQKKQRSNVMQKPKISDIGNHGQERERVVIDLNFMIHRKSKRLLFAEATSDFVDALMFFLLLPVGQVLNITDYSSGSIQNLRNIVDIIGPDKLTCEKDVLLKPSVVTSHVPKVMKEALRKSRRPNTIPVHLYTCNCNNPHYRSTASTCPACNHPMDRVVIHYVKSVNPIYGGQGFVEGSSEKYMVTDDLQITLMDAGILQRHLSNIGKQDLEQVEMVKVPVNEDQVKLILKLAWDTTKVLTAVFGEELGFNFVAGGSGEAGSGGA